MAAQVEVPPRPTRRKESNQRTEGSVAPGARYSDVTFNAITNTRLPTGVEYYCNIGCFNRVENGLYIIYTLNTLYLGNVY